MADINKLIQILNQKAATPDPEPKKIVTQQDIFKQHFGDLGNTYGQTLINVSGGMNPESTFKTNPKMGDAFPALKVVSKDYGKQFIVTRMYPNVGDNPNDTSTWTGYSEDKEVLTPEQFKEYYTKSSVERQKYLASEQAKRDAKEQAQKKLEKPMSEEEVARLNAILNKPKQQ